jgi:hypothetical protein
VLRTESFGAAYNPNRRRVIFAVFIYAGAPLRQKKKGTWLVRDATSHQAERSHHMSVHCSVTSTVLEVPRILDFGFLWSIKILHIKVAHS